MRLMLFLSLFFIFSTAKANTPNSVYSKNPRVQKWIKIFQKNDKTYFNKWLVKSKKKLPKIQAILKKQGLPKDLSYLPLIESGLNPTARSSANAVGYWQFMDFTAKAYGLKIDWWIDERHDLVKSTWAAGKYLRALYGMFDNWFLALSAYNMGETRLRRLIRRHKTEDFWTLSLKKGFPKETREYVPKFLAAALIAKNPQHYGFALKKKLPPFSYSYQNVPGGTDLTTIARELEIPSREIKNLNPELTRSYVPLDVDSHRIRVPKDFRTRVAHYFTKSVQ